MTAGHFENRAGTRLVVRDIFAPGEGDYESRTCTHLRMSGAFLSRVMTRAEADGVTVIQSHAHPFSGPGLRYSQTDFEGESESARTIRRCLGDMPMGSLLLGPDAMIGRVWTADGRSEPLHQLRVVGRRLSLLPMADRENGPSPAVDASLYDRQMRAFGAEGQAALSLVRIGVVGAGGIGSAAAEQMARAGVKHFTVLDSDEFAPSNMTRMYGTDASTESRPKAGIVCDNIQRIAPDAAGRVRAKRVPAHAAPDAGHRIALRRAAGPHCSPVSRGRLRT